jgi:hypothetical protein
VQQIEGEIGEALRPALFDGVLQVADMGHAAIVRDRNLPIENDLAAERK